MMPGPSQEPPLKPVAIFAAMVFSGLLPLWLMTRSLVLRSSCAVPVRLTDETLLPVALLPEGTVLGGLYVSGELAGMTAFAPFAIVSTLLVLTPCVTISVPPLTVVVPVYVLA